MHTKNMIRIAQSAPDLHSRDFLFVLLILYFLCSYSFDPPANAKITCVTEQTAVNRFGAFEE
jgi:hypothetical protein